jgi:phosphonate transport system permease protein
LILTRIAAPSEEVLADMRRRFPEVFRLGLRGRLYPVSGGILLATWVAFCLYRMDLSLPRLWQGIGKLGWMFQFLFPPSHGGWLAEFSYALLETVSMAFLGTLLAFLAAVPLGFLGAKNIIRNPGFHFGVRRLFDILRGVDTLIWALVFINVVGLGPFAGVMAIAAGDTGMLAKLFAEAIENVDGHQLDGVISAGASRFQVILFGVFPQILPVLLSNALFYFESNTRSATILGVVGAGGIGMQLADRIRINNWDEVAFIVGMILVTVAVIDWISKEIRMRLIRNPDYRV